ncbi:MAG TPA: ABC transporter substrate-binding protein [Fibrobacteraceae bacterium]|nr:ABC transporter substrate-binding protein [Fibrobacteraceae bacterium]
MLQKHWNTALPALASTLFLLACQSADSSKDEVFPREETLYVGGFDWATPGNFNPLASDPNWPIDGNIKLLYESLFAYDQLSGKLEPMLAASFRQKDHAMEVDLDTLARWNDGQPVTAQDVVFTFQVDSLFNTPRHGNWNFLANVKAPDSHTVILTLREDNFNPLVVLDMLSEVGILPQHIWEPLLANAHNQWEKILQFKNDKAPVGSGPYRLQEYSPERIVLQRNDSYWGNAAHHGGKLPAPKYIIHSLYNGNTDFNDAMAEGRLDLSSIFLPRIWTRTTDSIRAWSLKEPYHMPGSIPTLFIDLQHEPFSDKAFRHALAHGINYGQIKLLAVSNYTPALKPGFILPFGAEAHFFNQADADSFGYSFDLEKARKILTDAGYRWDSSGVLLNPVGSPVRSFTLECPQGWTDWEDVIKVAVESLQMLGLDAQGKFVDYPEWDRDVKLGKFDLIMKTQTADLFPSTPWKRFEQVMSSRDSKPEGQEVFCNFGRYRNPRADELLAKIPGIRDSVQLAEGYRELNRIFMQDLPVLPLMYRPTQFYQFSTKHWTHFPTEEAPYASPQNLMVGAGVKALWSIRPQGSH